MGLENKNQQTPLPKLSDDNLSKESYYFFTTTHIFVTVRNLLLRMREKKKDYC